MNTDRWKLTPTEIERMNKINTISQAKLVKMRYDEKNKRSLLVIINIIYDSRLKLWYPCESNAESDAMYNKLINCYVFKVKYKNSGEIVDIITYQKRNCHCNLF